MQEKPVINLKRIRQIQGGFSFVPNRFLKDGFFRSLDREELVLYFFLIVASDRFGMSWYGDASIKALTKLDQDLLASARDALIERELIAVESPFAQVLSLPEKPLIPTSRMIQSLKEQLT